MVRRSRTATVALSLVIAITGLSVFLIIVGLPGSYTSVSEQCSVGSQCVQTQQSGTYLVQTPVAAIPLSMGALVALGLVVNRMALSWAGMVGLLAFSFISLFSIGLLYMPFVITLVGLLSVIQSHKRVVPDSNISL